MPGTREIHSAAELSTALASGAGLRGLRVQDVDLAPLATQLLARQDVRGLAIFGGNVPADLLAHLVTNGAIVFPTDTRAPIDTYRASLYQAEELYAGLDDGYAGTPDARAYGWFRDGRIAHDALVTAARALHDDAMSDALAEVLGDRPVVGVMGGHALARGSTGYTRAAELGHRLAQAGYVVVTGGGPGAMEAANLGAFAASTDSMREALDVVAAAPGFDDVARWAGSGFAARRELGPARPSEPRSIGIPTWFYGHEPPNVFCDGIAKYFSNALREDALLHHASAGVIVLPGAAGTVQEIFQAVTPLYYAPQDGPMPRLVLVDTQYWTQRVPVAEALHALGARRRMAEQVSIVATIADAARLFPARP